MDDAGIQWVEPGGGTSYRVAVRDDERIWTIGLPAPGHYLVELPPSVARPGTPPKVTRLEPPVGEGTDPVTHLP